MGISAEIRQLLPGGLNAKQRKVVTHETTFLHNVAGLTLKAALIVALGAAGFYFVLPTVE